MSQGSLSLLLQHRLVHGGLRASHLRENSLIGLNFFAYMIGSIGP